MQKKYFEQYINEDVLVRGDSSKHAFEGKLLKIIPEKETDNRVDTLVIKTIEGEEQIPLNELMQFLPLRDFESEDTLYHFVIIRYGKTERSKEHIYMSLDDSVKVGDKVLVWQDWLYVGNVIRTGLYKRSEAPYPVEKTWLIEKRVFDAIDFMRYPEADSVISKDNQYPDRRLNSDNGHRQFVAKVDYLYQWLVNENDDYFETLEKYSDKERPYTSTDVISQMEYSLDWEWCESNQLEVFYRFLWLCSFLARHGCMDKFSYDKYLCLSLIYKHGDFDQYMLCPTVDKPVIERDIRIIDNYFL